MSPNLPRILPPRARAARERVRLSQDAAAKLIGCSRSTVGMWESREDGSISAEYLIPAARAYKVRPDWLSLHADDDGYPWSGKVVELAADVTAGARATTSSEISQQVRLDREMLRQAFIATERLIASHGATQTFPPEGRVDVALAIYDAMVEGAGLEQAERLVSGTLRAVLNSLGARA